jgi:two-component system CheB/CheR fusion protein
LIEFLTISSKRMKSRITGILDYSRLQDGSLEYQNVDMNSVVAAVMADFEPLIEEAGASIDVVALPNGSGSARLLSRVFQNLVSNSLKYRSPDRPCQITVEAVDAPLGMVGYAFTDNGIGIPEQYQKKVFELFSRLHTDKEFEGNGLGLALCERIITRHGGEISAHDNGDEGTRIVFTLKEVTR